MGPGSSDSPRAEAASAQEAVCASDSASPKATRSHCSRFSLHRRHDAQQQQGSQLRRRRRGPVHAARAVGSKVQRSISKRQQQLQDLEKDPLCLRIFNELLPGQLLSEVRQQLQSGAGQAAAVENVAKQRLARLAGADVRKLFLALAGTLSASCAVVHIAKGLVRSVAKPLRLRRPVGLLVNPVLMPTSLYGPLLGAYVITLAARGALRQLALEVQQEQQGPDADAAGDNAAAAVELKVAAGEHSEEAAAPAGDVAHAVLAASSSSSASTARRIAMYQDAVRTSSTSLAENVPQPLSKVRAGKGGSASSSNSNSPRVAPVPGQQQQQHKGKPWWALWKRGQRSKQQPTEKGSSSTASSSSSTACDTTAPQNGSSNSSFAPTAAAAAKCPSLPPTPGRQDTAAALAAVALASAASVSPAAGSPRSVDSYSNGALQHNHSSSAAVPALPTGGPYSAVLRSVTPPQQQQQPEEEPHVFAADAVDSNTNTSQQQPGTSRFAAAAAAAAAAPAGAFDYAEHQPTSHDEHPSAAAAKGNADNTADITDQPLDADQPQQQQLSVRTRPWTSRQSSDVAAAAGSDSSEVCSPSMAELEGQVSKLQRRWSSADNEAFLDELQAAQLRKAPFRPPVFSRLASGKGGCRITAAAAAQTAEEACGGCGGACGGAVSPHAAAALAPAGALSPQRTVSLDLGSDMHVRLQLEQQAAAGKNLDPAAAGATGSAVGSPVDVEVRMLSSKQQQQQQGLEQQQRTYKSLDWGHRLMTL